MVIEVNPPPQVPLPRKILEDKELRDFFIYQQEYLFKLWLRTGGGDDMVDSANQFVTTNQAALNDLNERIGSGDALTSDETGFSVDSTELSVDMTEA